MKGVGVIHENNVGINAKEKSTLLEASFEPETKSGRQDHVRRTEA